MHANEETGSTGSTHTTAGGAGMDESMDGWIKGLNGKKVTDRQTGGRTDGWLVLGRGWVRVQGVSSLTANGDINVTRGLAQKNQRGGSSGEAFLTSSSSSANESRLSAAA